MYLTTLSTTLCSLAARRCSKKALDLFADVSTNLRQVTAAHNAKVLTAAHLIGNRPGGALPRCCGYLIKKLIFETQYPDSADV